MWLLLIIYFLNLLFIFTPLLYSMFTSIKRDKERINGNEDLFNDTYMLYILVLNINLSLFVVVWVILRRQTHPCVAQLVVSCTKIIIKKLKGKCVLSIYFLQLWYDKKTYQWNFLTWHFHHLYISILVIRCLLPASTSCLY